MIKSPISEIYNFVNRYENLRQVIVYLIVGAVAALLDITLIFILVEFLHIWYLLAAVIAFISVATLGFFLHKKFTFRHTGGKNRLRYLIFLFIAGSGILWEVSFLFIFVEFFRIWYLIAAVMTKFIVLSWNFSMNKFITFRFT